MVPLPERSVERDHHAGRLLVARTESELTRHGIGRVRGAGKRDHDAWRLLVARTESELTPHRVGGASRT